MSKRRGSRRRPGPSQGGGGGGDRPLGGGHERVEEHPDGAWVVRSITGATSVKTYRCPGCDQEIRPATPHVVVWPTDERGSIDERRHWHTACWRRRVPRR